MGKLQKDQSGFSTVEVVLVLVIVALIGVVGFMVYKNHNKKTTTTSVATTTSTAKSTATTPAKTATPAPSRYAGWKTFTQASAGYTVKYPRSWTVVSYGPSPEQPSPGNFPFTGLFTVDIEPPTNPTGTGLAPAFGLEINSFNINSQYGQQSGLLSSYDELCRSTCTTPYSTRANIPGLGTATIMQVVYSGENGHSLLELTADNKAAIESPTESGEYVSASASYSPIIDGQTASQFHNDSNAQVATQILESISF